MHLLRRRRLWVILAGIVVFGVWMLVGRTPDAQAKSTYLTLARARYPTIVGTPLDSCSLCHTSVPARNPYGEDFRRLGHNFAAIESLDSDGDGYSNIVEINAHTFPGDPNSHPTGAGQPTATPTASAPVPTPPTGEYVTHGEYVVIAWNDLGMHCMNDSFADLAILPPYNTLYAQVIRQGEQPEIVTSGITVEYRILDNTYSAGKTDFWQYARQLFGVNLPPDVGLTGAGLAGQMRAEGDHFIVEGIPLTPYRDSAPNQLYPYQLAYIVVKDNATGQVLATTTTVAPVSTEMHCDSCHTDGMEGIATGKVETNILALHDKEEGTNLLASRPVLCAQCHADPALGTQGQPGVPNLSLAMHRKHAGGDEWDDEGDDGDGGSTSIAGAPNRATDEGTEDCYMCHPGYQTKCLRGTMAAAGMTCQDCHGSMRDVGNPFRRPWVDLPRCGNCHASQYAENPGQLYRNSKGHGGLYCEACHGSPHAILPSTQPNDNIQNIGLQGSAGVLRDCTVCHNPVPAGPGPHGLVATPGATPTPAPTPSLTPSPIPSPPATATPIPTPGRTRVFITPSPAQGIVGGDNITIQVRIENVTNLGGFEFTLQYDPNIVHVDTITLGDFLGSTGRTVSPLPAQIDNGVGRATFGAFTYGNAPGASGSGVLASVILVPQAAGQSTLTFPSIQVTDTDARLIPVGTSHGIVIIAQCPPYDLDCDGDVDIVDIMQVAAHWGCQQGDACYDARYDLDGDGDVDIVDIMQVAAHWGCRRGDACYGPGLNAGVSTLHLGRAQFRLGPARPAGGEHMWRVPVFIPSATSLDGAEFSLRLESADARVVRVVPGRLLERTGRRVLVLPARTGESAQEARVGFVTYGAGEPVTGPGHLLDILVRSQHRPRLAVASARAASFHPVKGETR